MSKEKKLIIEATKEHINNSYKALSHIIKYQDQYLKRRHLEVLTQSINKIKKAMDLLIVEREKRHIHESYNDSKFIRELNDQVNKFGQKITLHSEQNSVINSIYTSFHMSREKVYQKTRRKTLTDKLFNLLSIKRAEFRLSEFEELDVFLNHFNNSFQGKLSEAIENAGKVKYILNHETIDTIFKGSSKKIKTAKRKSINGDILRQIDKDGKLNDLFFVTLILESENTSDRLFGSAGKVVPTEFKIKYSEFKESILPSLLNFSEYEQDLLNDAERIETTIQNYIGENSPQNDQDFQTADTQPSNIIEIIPSAVPLVEFDEHLPLGPQDAEVDATEAEIVDQQTTEEIDRLQLIKNELLSWRIPASHIKHRQDKSGYYKHPYDFIDIYSQAGRVQFQIAVSNHIGNSTFVIGEPYSINSRPKISQLKLHDMVRRVVFNNDRQWSDKIKEYYSTDPKDWPPEPKRNSRWTEEKSIIQWFIRRIIDKRDLPQTNSKEIIPRGQLFDDRDTTIRRLYKAMGRGFKKFSHEYFPKFKNGINSFKKLYRALTDKTSGIYIPGLSSFYQNKKKIDLSKIYNDAAKIIEKEKIAPQMQHAEFSEALDEYKLDGWDYHALDLIFQHSDITKADGYNKINWVTKEIPRTFNDFMVASGLAKRKRDKPNELVPTP